MQAYTITVTAAFEGSAGSANDTITLTAVGSPLIAIISGPSGDMSADQVATFSAENSRDPDDSANIITPMQYVWSCQAADSTPCFIGTYQGIQSGATWAINLTQVNLSCLTCALNIMHCKQCKVVIMLGLQLMHSFYNIKHDYHYVGDSERHCKNASLHVPPIQATGSEYDLCMLCQQVVPDKQYTVTVTVIKGQGAYGRTASASQFITPRSVPVPTAEIERWCGADPITDTPRPCPAKHNPTDPLTLIATPDDNSIDAVLTWSFDPASVPGIVLSTTNTGWGVKDQALQINPSALPSSGSVTVQLQVMKKVW